jgi:hypothetical protein
MDRQWRNGKIMAISYAPIFINNYLSEKISEALSESFSGNLRFFPTSPTDIDALTESFGETSADVFAVYDRMFKLRRKAFPHIKCEQLLYYFYKTAGDLEALIDTTQIVADLLDREDESAQELNSWIQSKIVDGKVIFGGKEFKPVFFHRMKVFQLEESRDVIGFKSNRSVAGTKIIIDYDYHTKDYNNP